MEILSSSRSTILLDFQHLEKICSYENGQNESADFQFFNGKNIFTQINKKNGLEFLQIRPNNRADISTGFIDIENRYEKYEIHRLRKMKIENLYCVASLKAYEIALGMSNGEIRILNYKSNEYISKFPAETSKHSVISLDYNQTDEYLASVYENGSINIYGMKTKAKLETLNLDENSTLARFYSKKRFRLAVASYRGSVFIYDVQAHRKIFQSIEAHSAPCRDIAMSADNSDLLFSAGYDSVINIYDIKKRIRAQQIKCRYPLSTIAVSECGTYCCVGNLKGELISYDLRLLKKPLIERKIHDSAVIRVGFLPTTSSSRQSTLFPSQISHDNSADQNTLSTLNSEQKRDSFYEYIEFQNLHVNCRKSDATENGISGTKKTRESFDWEQLATRKNETDRRLSNKMPLSLMKKKLTNDFSPMNRLSSASDLSRGNSHTSDLKLNPDSNILQEVDEDNLLTENENQKDEIKQNEENSIQKDDVDMFLKVPNKNTNSSTSTPNNLQFHKHNSQEQHSKNTNGENFAINLEILNQIKELRLDVEKKFEYLENEIKFNAETNKFNLYSQNCNFWNKQTKVNNDICDALDILLHADDFYQDYCRLKEENEKLKLTVEELSKKDLF